MGISWPLTKLLYDLSEENYDRTFSAYRYWIGLEDVHGSVLNDKLYDILDNTKPDLIVPSRVQVGPHYFGSPPQYTEEGKLIHSNVHLLLRFITDAEVDPALSTYAIGLHDRLCRESLEQFLRQILDYIPGAWEGPTSEKLCEFYTRVNLIAHWINLGYVGLEDVKDHILQSFIFQPTVHTHQLNSLMILLKISGATFAAYVDPSVMDSCCDLLKPSNLSGKLVLTQLAEVRRLVLRVETNYEYRGVQEILRLRESGWEGLPPPPVLRSSERKAIISNSSLNSGVPEITSGSDGTVCKAEALYACRFSSVSSTCILTHTCTDTGSADDPNEISFAKRELLDILDKQGKWWHAKKSDGAVGSEYPSAVETLGSTEACIGSCSFKLPPTSLKSPFSTYELPLCVFHTLHNIVSSIVVRSNGIVSCSATPIHAFYSLGKSSGLTGCNNVS